MPISADPNRTVEAWLKSDEPIPMESRPVILSRFLTRRQITRHRELLDRAAKIGAGDEAWALVFDAWRIGIVGWRNMTLPDGTPAPAFEAGEKLPEILQKVLTDQEIQELAWNYPTRVRLAEADLKNSGSPSQNDAAACAEAAAPSAETNQANPPR